MTTAATPTHDRQHARRRGLQFEATDAEYRSIKATAARRGLTIQQLVRAALLDAARDELDRR